MKVIAIYDNGGKTADRYTFIIGGANAGIVTYPPGYGGGKRRQAIFMSDNCNMPNGVCMWGEVEVDSWDYLGEPISFVDLPEIVQRQIGKTIA